MNILAVQIVILAAIGRKQTMDEIKTPGTEDFWLFHTCLQGDTMQTHCRDSFVIVLMLKGKAQLFVDDVTHVVQERDVILLAPNLTYRLCTEPAQTAEIISVSMQKEYLMKLVTFDAQIGYAFDLCAAQNKCVLHLYTSSWQPIFSGFLQLESEMYAQKLSYQSSCYGILLLLLVHLGRTAYFLNAPMHPDECATRFTSLINYIDSNICAPLSLDSLSEQFFLNKFHIAHEFKKQNGVSFYHYVIQRRLILGKNSILSGTPIKHVHEMCGFKDYAGFYRAFKKEYGLSPHAFQLLHAKKED